MVPQLVTSFGMVILLAGCAHEPNEPQASPGTAAQRSPAAYYSGAMKGGFDDGGGPGGGGGGNAPMAVKVALPAVTQLKVVRTARLSLTVTDLTGVEERLTKILEPSGGFLASASSYQSDHGRRFTAVIRVPSPRFAEVLLAVRGLGTERTFSVEQEDVTSQLVDHESRLKVRRQEEERLVRLLDTAVGKLEDLLLIEKELLRIREEIESTEQRLKSVSQLVELATIHFEASEVRPKPPVPEEPPKVYTNYVETTVAQRFHRAFFGSWAEMFDFSERILLTIVALVPWTPFLVAGVGLPYLGCKRWVRSA